MSSLPEPSALRMGGFLAGGDEQGVRNPRSWLCGLARDRGWGRKEAMRWEWGGERGGGRVGGAQLSVEKMKAQFTQPAGVEAHI